MYPHPAMAYILVSGLRRVGLKGDRTGGGAGLHDPIQTRDDRRADPGFCSDILDFDGILLSLAKVSIDRSGRTCAAGAPRRASIPEIPVGREAPAQISAPPLPHQCPTIAVHAIRGPGRPRRVTQIDHSFFARLKNASARRFPLPFPTEPSYSV